MKKYLLNIVFTFVTMTVMCLSLISCGDDGDGSDGNGNWRTQPSEELDAAGYENAVKKGVLATLSNPDKYHLRLELTSNLATLYPGKKIVYYVIITYVYKTGRNQYNSETRELDFTDVTDYLSTNDLYVFGNSGFDAALARYEELQTYKKTRTLSKDEKDEEKDLAQIMDEIISNTKFEFYVEINGKRYEIPTKYK